MAARTTAPPEEDRPTPSALEPESYTIVLVLRAENKTLETWGHFKELLATSVNQYVEKNTMLLERAKLVFSIIQENKY